MFMHRSQKNIPSVCQGLSEQQRYFSEYIRNSGTVCKV